jgi:CheY-like chemotaxis protein
MVVSQAFPPRVLVSDDTPDLLALVEAILSENGYAVTASGSLPTALALVEEQLFHFILTDLYAQSGLSPFQGIAPLIAQAQPTPIAVMTAWPLSYADVTQAGASYLLSKPFGMADLLQAVEQGVQSSLHKPEQEVQRQVVEQFFHAWTAQDWAQLARLCTLSVRFLPPTRQGQDHPDDAGPAACWPICKGRCFPCQAGR